MGVLGSPFRRSRIGRVTLPEVRNWSVGPPGGLGVDARSFHSPGSGRQAIPEVRVWSGFPTGGPEEVG